VTIRTCLRWAVVATAALAAAGPAAGSPPRIGGPPVLPAACPASGLGATYTMVFGSNATGHVEYTLTLTNRGRGSCTVITPLTLTLLGAHGQALATNPQYSSGPSQHVVLAAGQWAQAVSELSPDLFGPGEPATGSCEPIAHALRITIGGESVRAAMDPTPVCQHGTIEFDRLRAVPTTIACPGHVLAAQFTRQDVAGGFAEYALNLRNRSPTACHVRSIVGLQLLGPGGRRLATHVTAGVSSPFVIRGHNTDDAVARLATSGGHCDAKATELRVIPVADGGTTTDLIPPASVCRRGLIQLSSLFHNG
jgi:Protein of unknown function (DUF4232)